MFPASHNRVLAKSPSDAVIPYVQYPFSHILAERSVLKIFKKIREAGLHPRVRNNLQKLLALLSYYSPSSSSKSNLNKCDDIAIEGGFRQLKFATFKHLLSTFSWPLVASCYLVMWECVVRRWYQNSRRMHPR